MAPRALALLALPLLVAPRAVALAPTPLAPLSPLEVKRLQVFSAFDDGETRLAMRLIEAAAMEEAETPGGLADSATGAFAASLARLRRRAFPGAADGPWRDGELAAWPWTAPLAAARRAAAAELGAVAAARWDAAEYEAIARDWAFLPLWQRGAFTEWADAMPATRRALEGALAAGLRLHPLQDFACGVARMEAGSRIAEHCDGGLLSFTCHLGLDVPEGCALTVGGEARRWRAGEFLAFDPSWPHSAENPTAADRYVLLLQPLRDDVADADVAAVAHFLDPATRPPPHAAHPFWLVRGRRGLLKAHGTWLGANATHVELAAGRAAPRGAAALVYPAPPSLGAFQARRDGRWAAAPFFDAEASAGEPLRAGDVVAPAYVAVDDGGGVDWIAASDADWTDVLRDPGRLSWLPLEGAEGPLLDQVDEVAADAAPADKAEAAPAEAKVEAAPAEAKAEAAPAPVGFGGSARKKRRKRR